MDDLLLNRRSFVKQAGLAAAALAFPWNVFGKSAKPNTRLTILFTNDTHSRIDAFPANGPNAGMGGIAARKKLIDAIRKQEEHVLLFDAGDIFQGTPYFNFFKGALEMKAMQWLGYDAATLGNHDFDEGVENLVKQMGHTQFPFVVANYQVDATPLKGKVKPYHVFVKGGKRIGVFGLGIDPKGLIPEKLFGKVVYTDPYEAASRMVAQLRIQEKCELVICLSHLGYRYQDEKPSDVRVASMVSGIDVIIGGHTHTVLEVPEKISQSNGGVTYICQTGHSGIRLGRIDLEFMHKRLVVNDSKSTLTPVILPALG